MGRKRRCRVCGNPYDPDPRTAKWQRVCGAAECQQARHAAACAAWRAKNPDYDRERRLCERIVVDPLPEVAAVDPRAAVSWDAVRDALSMEAAVVARELAGIFVGWARDEWVAKQSGPRTKSARISARRPRDETDRRGPGP